MWLIVKKEKKKKEKRMKHGVDMGLHFGPNWLICRSSLWLTKFKPICIKVSIAW